MAICNKLCHIFRQIGLYMLLEVRLRRIDSTSFAILKQNVFPWFLFSFNLVFLHARWNQTLFPAWLQVQVTDHLQKRWHILADLFVNFHVSSYILYYTCIIPVSCSIMGLFFPGSTPEFLLLTTLDTTYTLITTIVMVAKSNTALYNEIN
jgi:hypothetical protein